MNDVLIYWKDITPSPGYLKGQIIFKLTAVALGTKRFSGSRIQVKNSKCSGYVQVRSTDRNEFFLKLDDDDNRELTKLIQNRSKCKLIVKTTAVCMYANEQMRLCFNVLGRYSLDIHF